VAVETSCQTPGAVFETHVDASRWTIQVDLPAPMKLTAQEADLVSANLHNAVELVLAPHTAVASHGRLTVPASELERLMNHAAYHKQEAAQKEEEYEIVRDAVIEAFNPPDDDAAEPSIMAEAVERARAYIEQQPCLCTPELIADQQPCGRCWVLGQCGGEPVSR